MKIIVKGERMGWGGGGGKGWGQSRTTSDQCDLGPSPSLDVTVVRSLRPSESFLFSRFSFSSFYLQRTFQILIRCGGCFQLAEITDFKMVLKQANLEVSK